MPVIVPVVVLLAGTGVLAFAVSLYLTFTGDLAGATNCATFAGLCLLTVIALVVLFGISRL